MAVLATPDWLYNTRENTMDVPTNSRQRTSPANESSSVQNLGLQQAQPSQSQHLQHQQTLHQHQQQQQFQQQQQLLQQQQMLLAAAQQHSQAAFTYQQQPHGSWTPNITAAPFYPSFFQNPQQQQTPQAYPGQLSPQTAYFDPANAQLAAQWAYQQMMFNAQHAFPGQHPQRPSSANQQGQPSSPTDHFSQNPVSPVFSPFPSGTPPAHAHRTPSAEHTQQGPHYPGFHPYRRPNRQQSQPHSPADSAADWRQGMPHPPYARPDASGSSSSVSSSSSRQRTNSNQSVQSNGHSNNNRRPSPVSATGAAGRPKSPRSSQSPAGGSASPSSQPSNPSPLRQPHHRNASTSSSTSTATSIRPGALSPAPPTSSVSTTAATATSITASSSNSGSATPRLTRPSPLSQGTFTAAEKRISRDDIDLGAMHDASQSASSRSGGLKGRLRRALSFNTAQVLKEEEVIEEDDDASIKASQVNNTVKGKASSNQETSFKANSSDKASANANDSGVDEVSSTRAPTQPKKKNKAAALFNSRMNMSTDNISLSSTVSSASVMIRKLGAMGRLARRNSLAGIASLFKDKDKDKDGDNDKKGKKKDKKSAKAEASEASVSHVTAELDRMGGDWTVNSAELQGLTPAAKLARQHTLKSNAEAAAKAKEAAAAAAAAREAEAAASSNKTNVNGNGNAQIAGVATWDRNTATRQGSSSPIKGNVRVNEDGTRTLIEDEDDESDDGHYGHQQGSSYGGHSDGWDEDEDWDVDGDEDVTIREDLNRRSTNSDDTGYEHGHRRPSAEMEPWAVDVRRSTERNIRPAKGILRNANTYDQNRYLQHDHVTILSRGRSNSYTSTNANTEIGPLARMPSPDPDHIDGLRHNPHSSANRASPLAETTTFTLPPLSFDSSPSPLNASFNLTTPKEHVSPIPLHVTHSHSEHRTSAIYQNPTFNSSAPALSSIGSGSSKLPPTLAHRSQTAPIKRLTFASNLSVYDTFSSTVYDRRSEPATWSRLTPVLAQRIKEELNSYKMEEMEVHAASRIHTQFFV